MATIIKFTNGFVKQEFDTETGKCITQEFFAVDNVEYEDIDGKPTKPLENEKYQPFDMVQPE